MEAKKINTLLGMTLLGIGLIFLIAVGFKFWNVYVVPGFSQLATASVAFWLVFAFLAGLASFFSPCAFALFPGYIAFYLGTSKETDHSPKVNPARLGFLGALGILIFFMILKVKIHDFLNLYF